MQSVFFYQVKFLSYLRISIFVKALLLDFPVTSQISIHVLSVACLLSIVFLWHYKCWSRLLYIMFNCLHNARLQVLSFILVRDLKLINITDCLSL